MMPLVGPSRHTAARPRSRTRYSGNRRGAVCCRGRRSSPISEIGDYNEFYSSGLRFLPSVEFKQLDCMGSDPWEQADVKTIRPSVCRSQCGSAKRRLQRGRSPVQVAVWRTANSVSRFQRPTHARTTLRARSRSSDMLLSCINEKLLEQFDLSLCVSPGPPRTPAFPLRPRARGPVRADRP